MNIIKNVVVGVTMSIVVLIAPVLAQANTCRMSVEVLMNRRMDNITIACYVPPRLDIPFYSEELSFTSGHYVKDLGEVPRGTPLACRVIYSYYSVIGKSGGQLFACEPPIGACGGPLHANREAGIAIAVRAEGSGCPEFIPR